jgi:hypothetical protein
MISLLSLCPSASSEVNLLGGQTNRQTVRTAENIGRNEDSNRKVNRKEVAGKRKDGPPLGNGRIAGAGALEGRLESRHYALCHHGCEVKYDIIPD